LWSAGKARRDYLAWISKSNPNSPLNRYPRSTIVSTQVESVSPIAPQTALVRFRTERRNANQVASAPDYWVAVLRYRYSSEPLTLEDRITNPLGFQVVHYRRDQEAPPPDNVGALDRASAVPPAPAQPAARAAVPAGPSPLVGPNQRQQPDYYYGDGL
jgi:type IV secretion system protein VirB8